MTLVNNCSYQVSIKQRFACNKKNGVTLGKIVPGGTYTVKGFYSFSVFCFADQHITLPICINLVCIQTLLGKNFIAEGGNSAGDPFDLWVGDGTWMNVNLTLTINDAGGGYLSYDTV